MEKIINYHDWEKNKQGSVLCYTCGQYSIRTPNQKHRLSFWTNNEETDITLLKKSVSIHFHF